MYFKLKKSKNLLYFVGLILFTGNLHAQNLTENLKAKASQNQSSTTTDEWKVLQQNGWNCFVSGKEKLAPQTLTIERDARKLIINIADGAVISSIQPDACVLYDKKGGGGLFRDLFSLPQDNRHASGIQLSYQFEKIELLEDEISIKFKTTIAHPNLEGLVLEKVYVIAPDLKTIDAEITVHNPKPQTFEFTYLTRHSPAVSRESTTYKIAGQEPIVVSENKGENLFVKSNGSQWAKLSEKFFFGWNKVNLDRFCFWSDSSYTPLELIGEPVKLAQRKSWQVILNYRILPPQKKQAPLHNFSIYNPYAIQKKHAWRASLHNHTQFEPAYKHAPVPSPARLIEYRDHKVTPPYGVVVITEHNRITLPSNTIPTGEEPQWGVEGILFVPGNELCIGSHRAGADCGKLFGELNCVGVSRDLIAPENKSHARQKHRHERSFGTDRRNPAKVISDLINDGVFISLCHPNSRLDEDGVHRWPSSGYTWDELDIIFGNPEKGLLPFPRLPYALEIGNQGYDFTARSDFINAEAKWDYLLSQGHRVFGTASDDSHGRTAFAGWVVVNMNELTQDEFLENLKSGNFYASQGPNINLIKLENRTITIATDTPALLEFIGKNGQILKSQSDAKKSSYTIKGDEVYVRGRVTRECPEVRNVDGGGIGRRRSAWTNPFFITGVSS